MMTTMHRRLVLVGVWVGVVLLGSGAFWLHGQAVTLRTEQQKLRATRERLDARLATAREETAKLIKDIQARQRALTAAEQRRTPRERRQWAVRETLTDLLARPEVPKGRRFPPSPSGPHGDIFQELMSDPVYAGLYAAEARWSIEGHYAELFSKLPVSPETLEKLKGLLLDLQMVEYDTENVAALHGLSFDSDRYKIADLRFKVEVQFRSEIHPLLGDAAYDQFKQYETERGPRETVDALALRMSYSPEPLQPSQSVQLMEIFQGVLEWHPGLMSDEIPPIPEEKIAQAQRVLSPAQFEQLQQFLLERTASVPAPRAPAAPTK
jgi:hypothetical protein